MTPKPILCLNCQALLTKPGPVVPLLCAPCSIHLAAKQQAERSREYLEMTDDAPCHMAYSLADWPDPEE